MIMPGTTRNRTGAIRFFLAPRTPLLPHLADAHFDLLSDAEDVADVIHVLSVRGHLYILKEKENVSGARQRV